MCCTRWSRGTLSRALIWASNGLTTLDNSVDNPCAREVLEALAGALISLTYRIYEDRP